MGEAVRGEERYFADGDTTGWENGGVATVQLTKHHGLGNDFLILIDLEDRHRLTPSTVRHLCDRHRGLGADGLIRVVAGRDGAAVAMELHNADGSPAQTSGNGLRCLAQAVGDAGAVSGLDFVVSTPAGPRPVSVGPGPRPGEVEVRVGMGVPEVGPDQSQGGPGGRPVDPAGLGGGGTGPTGEVRCRWVGMGNPHLVLLGGDPFRVDLAELGSRMEAAHPGGVNVEVVALGPGPDELRIRVWERGVGETQACGTGSVAAAAAARAWGLVGDHLVVHNPGGPLEVDLSGPTAVLTGPSQKVATIRVDLT